MSKTKDTIIFIGLILLAPVLIPTVVKATIPIVKVLR